MRGIYKVYIVYAGILKLTEYIRKTRRRYFLSRRAVMRYFVILAKNAP